MSPVDYDNGEEVTSQNIKTFKTFHNLLPGYQRAVRERTDEEKENRCTVKHTQVNCY